jgi:trimeric autotransporter adhesin
VKHVKFHLNRFLRRVRIHGGEFDTSARAMYREGVTSSLRADLRIVRRSTIERKQMSTKTTFKRIALVTVAALGFGVMSVVPSNAAHQSDTLTLSASTASMLTGETKTAVTVSTSFLSSSQSDTISVTAYLTAQPAGSTAVPVLSVNDTTTAFVYDTVDPGVATAKSVNAPVGQVAYVSSSSASPSYATAKLNVLLSAANGTSAAVKAGTYKVLFAIGVAGGGGTKATTTTSELVITVAANPATDTVVASVDSYMLPLSDTTTASDVAVTGSKSLSTDANPVPVLRGHIVVTQYNAAGKIAAAESITAMITSGPGTLGQQLLDEDVSTNTNPSGRAISLKKGNVIDVFSDGSSGVSTITLTSASGKELAKESMTFFGSASTIKATVVSSVIGAGAGTGAVLLTVTDKDGTQVSDLGTSSFFVTSDKVAAIAGGRAAVTSAVYSATNGTLKTPGYLVNLNSVSTAAGTASLTFGTCSAAPTSTSTCVDQSNAVSIRVGSSTPASVAVSLDKASYVPGELATVSVVLKDKDGLTLADGNYTDIFATGGISTSYGLYAGDTLTSLSVLGFKNGVKTYSVFMPIAEASIDFKWTGGSGLATANAGVAGPTVTVTTVSNSGSSAQAAAEEAQAAANDATDAALSAAEAADAATAMAQEAVDAVAELSAQVTKLISDLKAQITALTTLVAKISKKVKA